MKKSVIAGVAVVLLAAVAAGSLAGLAWLYGKVCAYERENGIKIVFRGDVKDLQKSNPPPAKRDGVSQGIAKADKTSGDKNETPPAPSALRVVKCEIGRAHV